jgi:hypothetical protein
MSIRIHIERLILDGLPVQPRDGALFQAAVEAELSRLVTLSGIPSDFQTGGNQARIDAPALQLMSSPDAKVLGAQVGEGIYGAFAGLNQRGQGHG